MGTTRCERHTKKNWRDPQNVAFLMDEECRVLRWESGRLREAHLQKTQSRGGPPGDSGNGRKNEDVKDTEVRKAVRVFWDGSKKKMEDAGVEL